MLVASMFGMSSPQPCWHAQPGNASASASQLLMKSNWDSSHRYNPPCSPRWLLHTWRHEMPGPDAATGSSVSRGATRIESVANGDNLLSMRNRSLPPGSVNQVTNL